MIFINVPKVEHSAKGTGIKFRSFQNESVAKRYKRKITGLGKFTKYGFEVAK